jgi:hypothetical protein
MSPGVLPRLRPDLPAGSLTQGDLYGIFKEDPRSATRGAPSRVSRHGWVARQRARCARRRGNLLLRPRRNTACWSSATPCGGDAPSRGGHLGGAGCRRPGPTSRSSTSSGRLLDGAELPALPARAKGGGGWTGDAAVFHFVPRQDPWRDVNVSRWVGDGWPSYIPLPRFVLAGDDLRLVRAPYPKGTDVYRARLAGARAPRCATTCSLYDRLYDPCSSNPRRGGALVSWKLLALWMAERRKAATRRDIEDDLDGEAFPVRAHSCPGAARGGSGGKGVPGGGAPRGRRSPRHARQCGGAGAVGQDGEPPAGAGPGRGGPRPRAGGRSPPGISTRARTHPLPVPGPRTSGARAGARAPRPAFEEGCPGTRPPRGCGKPSRSPESTLLARDRGRGRRRGGRQ